MKHWQTENMNQNCSPKLQPHESLKLKIISALLITQNSNSSYLWRPPNGVRQNAVNSFNLSRGEVSLFLELFIDFIGHSQTTRTYRVTKTL